MYTLFEEKVKNRMQQHTYENGPATAVLSTTKDSWQLWCRLCAKEDPEGNVSILLKDEQQFGRTIANASAKSTIPSEDKVPMMNLSLVLLVEKYFAVQITCDEKFPKMLCTECFSLITSLVNFTERVAKVQKMFHTLTEDSEGFSALNLKAIRLKYGLLDEDREHVLMYQAVPEIHYLETTTINNNKAEGSESASSKIVNPLEQPRITMKIKKEHISDCYDDDHHYDDNNDGGDDECPFDNDDNTTNNLDEHFVDVLLLPTNEASKSSGSIELSDGNKEKGKRKLRASKTKYISKKCTPQKRRGRPRRLSSSGKINENDRKQSKKEGNESNVEAVPCPECGRKFKGMQGLSFHLSKAHSIRMPPQEFACPDCSHVSNSRYTYKQHLTTHLPDEQRKIVPCTYCDKKFSRKFHMEIHVKHVHMNERPLVCDKCGVAVRTIGALKEHMLTHTDYAPFKCEICDKHYKDKNRLKRHMKLHNPNKHICAECGLQLNSRATLKRHLLVHSDVLQHKCDYCGRAFKRVKTLKNHLLLHTGLKPYACNFCDRTFASGANCRSHKKKSHPVELAALEASGGGKTYTRNIPTLETLKAITRTADNLAPVEYKPGRCVSKK